MDERLQDQEGRLSPGLHHKQVIDPEALGVQSYRELSRRWGWFDPGADRRDAKPIHGNIDVGACSGPIPDPIAQDAADVDAAIQDLGERHMGDANILNHPALRVRLHGDVNVDLADRRATAQEQGIRTELRQADGSVDPFDRQGQHAVLKLPPACTGAAMLDEKRFDPGAAQQDCQRFQAILSVGVRVDEPLAGGAPIVAPALIGLPSEDDETIAMAGLRRKVPVDWVRATNRVAPPQFDDAEMGQPIGGFENLGGRRNELLSVTEEFRDQLNWCGSGRRAFPSRRL